MSHSHRRGDHSHAGHVPAAPPPGGQFSAAFAWGIGLNLAFVVAEVIGGLWANSAALLSDAGHNLSDALSLGRGLAGGPARHRALYLWLPGRHHSGRFAERGPALRRAGVYSFRNH